MTVEYMNSLSESLQSVYMEVMRDKGMFNENFHNQHEGYAVILGELDELWEEIKKNQMDYDIAAQRKEAIQCAAMLMRFIVELTPESPSLHKQVHPPGEQK